MHLSFQGKRCLVTGGTGFIGSRLVESLARDGAEVRVLLTDRLKAARAARFSLEFVAGDPSVEDDVWAAVGGCDYVFDLAAGEPSGESLPAHVLAQGSRHTASAALKNGSRLVHLDRPLGKNRTTVAETIVEMSNGGGLKGCVLQPTKVYGPFATEWTAGVLERLRTGPVILIDGGEAQAHFVYVDDVVEALRHAILRDETIGTTLTVTGPEPVSWREFYGAFERLIGYESHVDLSAHEALRYYDRQHGRKHLLKESAAVMRGDPELRHRLYGTREMQMLLKVARRVVPERMRKKVELRLTGGPEREVTRRNPPPEPARPWHELTPQEIEEAQRTPQLSTEESYQRLDFEPAIDWKAGMERVAGWARWAGYAPPLEAEPVEPSEAVEPVPPNQSGDKSADAALDSGAAG